MVPQLDDGRSQRRNGLIIINGQKLRVASSPGPVNKRSQSPALSQDAVYLQTHQIK